MRAVGGAIVLLAACGRIGYDQLGASVDAGDGGVAPLQGYIKASNTGAGDVFGISVAISADGSTLAVGASEERSAATGIGGDQTDDSVSAAGAVYVFVRAGDGPWSQQAYVKASNTGPGLDVGDSFGQSVALSADGSVLAVGAPLEDSAAAGIDGNQLDDTTSAAGAVYVFSRGGTTWTQDAYVKASNPHLSASFGIDVALSADGDTLAVGAELDASIATGINGNDDDRSAPDAGGAFVFVRDGQTWVQQAYIKASNTNSGDAFGTSVALSGSGSTLAVGAPFESSAATGIGGDQSDNTASVAGAVYMFERTAGTWAQDAYVKASNTGAGDLFGIDVALSQDGSTLAVGAYGEASAATGIDGDEGDDSVNAAGAVYVFVRAADPSWKQAAYVKASNAGAGDAFGASVSLSSDGARLVVGSPVEASAATGIDGDQMDESARGAGAVYLYTGGPAAWAPGAYIKAPNTDADDRFGVVALAASDLTLAVGALFEASAATGVGGDQDDDSAPNAGAAYVLSAP